MLTISNGYSLVSNANFTEPRTGEQDDKKNGDNSFKRLAGGVTAWVLPPNLALKYQSIVTNYTYLFIYLFIHFLSLKL